MNKELKAVEDLRNCYTPIYNGKAVSFTKEFFDTKLDIIETALKRIPELEKEIEDTHKAYSMAIEKHIKDENEYIKWVQKGGYDKKKLEALEILKSKKYGIGKLYINTHEQRVSNCIEFYDITDEEFDLIKEVLL